jgi:hypothetical protein
MTIKNVNYTMEGFQNYVTANDGYILSDGTLHNLHLLTKAYDFICLWEITAPRIEEIKQDILKCFQPTEDYYEVNGNLSLFVQQYHGEIELKSYEEMTEEHGWSDNDVWNDDVFNLFQKISPDGFYFGNSEGDGACIGWFKFEEEEEEEEE